MRFLKAGASYDPRRPTRRRPHSRYFRTVTVLLAVGGVAVGLSAAAGWASQAVRLEDRIAAFKGNALSASANFGLTLQEVVVTGRKETDRSALLVALGQKRGDTILTFDVDEARARIEALPWVKSAQVERAFPETVRVSIIERKPLAIWQNEGRLELIDTEGNPIRTGDLRRFRQLPIVVGPDAAEHAPALFQLVAGYPEIAARVTDAVRVAGRRWNLRLDEQTEISLPEEQPVEALQRLDRLERDSSLLERDIIGVDLRYGDRIVVRLAPGAEDHLRSPERSTARRELRETGRT